MTDTRKNACYVRVYIANGRFIQCSAPTLHIFSNKYIVKTIILFFAVIYNIIHIHITCNPWVLDITDHYHGYLIF